MDVVSDTIDPKLLALPQDIDLINFTFYANLNGLAIAIDVDLLALEKALISKYLQGCQISCLVLMARALVSTSSFLRYTRQQI